MSTSNTVTLHRIIKASPEKMYRAFSEVNAVRFWFPPYGFLCNALEYDFKIGGIYKMSFTNFSTGMEHAFGGRFIDITPNEMIKQSDKFDDANMPDEMITTITFKKVLCGTELTIIQEGIPAQIPVEMCYLGWQESLDKLTKLVEPEIADA